MIPMLITFLVLQQLVVHQVVFFTGDPDKSVIPPETVVVLVFGKILTMSSIPEMNMLESLTLPSAEPQPPRLSFKSMVLEPMPVILN